jgi:hypothetical protein
MAPDLICSCGEVIDQCGNHFMACDELSGELICSRPGVVVATEALIAGGRMDITLHNLDKFPPYADV